MAWASQVRRNCIGIDGDADRSGAVLGTDASRDAETLVGIDADGERRPVFVGVHFALRSQLELVSTLAGKGETNPAAGFADHEVDHLRRDELGGANKVALVLAILVVGDDDQLARFYVGDCLVDGSKLHTGSSAPTRNR